MRRISTIKDVSLLGGEKKWEVLQSKFSVYTTSHDINIHNSRKWESCFRFGGYNSTLLHAATTVLVARESAECHSLQENRSAGRLC